MSQRQKHMPTKARIKITAEVVLTEHTNIKYLYFLYNKNERRNEWRKRRCDKDV